MQFSRIKIRIDSNGSLYINPKVEISGKILEKVYVLSIEFDII